MRFSEFWRAVCALVFGFVVGCGCGWAYELSELTWSRVCMGHMGDEWYGSSEAQEIADRVLYVQRQNGGWPKNYELHLLSPDEIEAIHSESASFSCLDNYATTQEMQYLARVFAKTGIERYRESFKRGLEMIFESQKSNGGWSQYWPLYNKGDYHDYITFNDNLITNVLRLLDNIKTNKGNFTDIVDADSRARCTSAYDRCIDLIIKCQVDDNGVLSAWCAQHDNNTLQPTEGRAFELPSISGYESFSLLSYLMTIEQPTPALQNSIRAAIAWLDAHKIPDKAVEDYTNEQGLADKRIIDKPGSSLWGRFIQFGGATGEATYKDFFSRLRARNKIRQYTWEGKVYYYSEYEVATRSYRPEMAYEPIYSTHTDYIPYLLCRFLYNYEDTDPVTDNNGVPVPTSLDRQARTNYSFIGDWGMQVINVECPAWELRMQALGDSEGSTLHILSQKSYTHSETDGTKITYHFGDGFSVTNNRSKAYGAGPSYTGAIKYSANIDYTINLPEGLEVNGIRFTGYNNYADAEAYLHSCNGLVLSPSDFNFPAKDETGNPQIVSYKVDFKESPATGSIDFRLEGKQCGLVITLYARDPESGERIVLNTDRDLDDQIYDLQGRRVEAENMHKGIYIKNKQKIAVR